MLRAKQTKNQKQPGKRRGSSKANRIKKSKQSRGRWRNCP